MGPEFLFESVKFADWMFNIAFQSTVVLLLSLLIRRLCRRSAAPIRSNICLITMAILLILPFAAMVSIQTKPTRLNILPQPAEIKRNIDESFGRFDEESMRIISSGSTNEKPVQTSKSSATLSHHKFTLFGIIWLSGSLLFLIRLGHGLLRVNKFKSCLSELDDPNVRKVLKTVTLVFDINKPPGLYTSPLVNSPQTLGVVRPCIVFPENFSGLASEEELRSILLHEMSHVYHMDHWTGLMQRIVTALYWWHPLVYSLVSEFTMEREYISDNYAISHGNPMVFARSLLKLAKNAYQIRQLPATLGVATSKTTLETRIKTIISDKRSTETKTKKRTFTFQISAAIALLGLLLCVNWTTAAQKVLEKTATFPYLENPHMMDIDEDYIYVAENDDLYIIDRSNFLLKRTIRNIGVGDMWSYRIRDINVKSDRIYTTTKYYVRLFDKQTGEQISTFTNWKRKLGEVVPFGDKLIKVYWEKPNTVLSLCDLDLENCKTILKVEDSECDFETKKCNYFGSSWSIDNDDEQLIVAMNRDFTILRFDKNGNRLPDIIMDYPERVPVTNEFIEANLERWKTKDRESYKYLTARGYQLDYPKHFPAIAEVTISNGIIYASTYRIKDNRLETYIFDSDGHFIEKSYVATKYAWSSPSKGPSKIREGKSFELAWDQHSWHLYVSEIN